MFPLYFRHIRDGPRQREAREQRANSSSDGIVGEKMPVLEGVEKSWERDYFLTILLRREASR